MALVTTVDDQVRQYNNELADAYTQEARPGNHYAPRGKCRPSGPTCAWDGIDCLETFLLASHQLDAGPHVFRCRCHSFRCCFLFHFGMVLEQAGSISRKDSH